MNFRFSNYYVNKEIKIFLVENQNLFGECLLDFGCGDSPYRKYINSVSSYQEVDLFENQNNENYKKIELNKQLPFDNKTFNSIISSQVIYQLEDLDFYLKEFNRILKPNGKIIVTVPFIWFDTKDQGHINARYSYNQLIKIFKKNKFDLVKFKPLNTGLESTLILFNKIITEYINKIKFRIIRFTLRNIISILINLLIFLIKTLKIFPLKTLYLNSGFIFKKTQTK